MSEFTNNRERRISQLFKLFEAILTKTDLKNLLKYSKETLDNSIPSDIVGLVDRIIKSGMSVELIKIPVNKLIHLLYTSVMNFPYQRPAENSFLYLCVKNNQVLDQKLKDLKPLIKALNKDFEDRQLQKDVVEILQQIVKVDKYYKIKENVLFPVIEKNLKEYKCLSLMWSIHDDIRSNLKILISGFVNQILDLKEFNKIIGMLYFNIYAIIFREERILFPYIEENINNDVLDSLITESSDLGFPFYQIDSKILNQNISIENTNEIDLKTGTLSVEQIILLFNHLPVDLTFVDENNKVKFFSAPEKRIFPRTVSIIGRDVKNCHPPESVHIVEQIVDDFRFGKRNIASFWIQMNEQFILIQYFAIRSNSGEYKGVLEVSQEITDIKKLEGEKRLLDEL